MLNPVLYSVHKVKTAFNNQNHSFKIHFVTYINIVCEMNYYFLIMQWYNYHNYCHNSTDTLLDTDSSSEMCVFLFLEVFAVKANCRDEGTCLVSFAHFDMVCLALSQLLPPDPFGVEVTYILRWRDWRAYYTKQLWTKQWFNSLIWLIHIILVWSNIANTKGDQF